MSANLINSSDFGVQENRENLQACRCCLATDIELQDIHERGLSQVFGEFVGLPVYPKDGYPQSVCNICLFLLQKFFKFRKRCLAAMWTLQQMRFRNETITTDTIRVLDKDRLKNNFNSVNVCTLYIGDENDDDLLLIDLLNNKAIKFINEDTKSDDETKKERKKKTAKRKKSTAKIEETPIQKFEVEIVDVKQENESDDCLFDYKDDTEITDFEEEKIEDIKEEVEEKVAKKKSAKRKAIKQTKAKVKKKRTSSLTENEGDEINCDNVEISDVWKTIIKEIEEENKNDNPIKRRVPTKADIQLQIKKAMKFSNAYNVEVKFLTKEEQKLEIEEKRNSEEYKKAQYKCEICCKILKMHTFETHAKVHKPATGEFECEICKYRYKTRPRYQEHFYKMHAKRISCIECGLIVRNWTSAQQHHLWHRGENNNHTCVLCNKNFSHRRNYLRHLQNKHEGGGGPQCMLCDRAFTNDIGLKSHLDRAHKNNPHCSSCNAVFVDTEALSSHLNAPEGCFQGQSSCTKCGSNFPNESIMKAHYDEEHRKNYYKCEQCNRAFKDLKKYTTHLNYHNWRDHGTVRGAVEASNKRWGPPRNGVIKADKEPRHDGKFVCEVCGIEKKYLATLRYHQRIHTGEKPYQCHICNKTFRQQATLQSHIAIHTGERRYKCPICQKAFRQMQHRTAHLLTHTKERPYACKACPKRYTGPSALKDHVNTAHLGLPPRKWGTKKIQHTESYQ